MQYELLTRKGIYPYEYMSSWDRFEETRFPPIEAFYSKLNMSSISSDDYQHAQRVWKEFRIHNLGDYHDLYLRIDVVLLANVYEAFMEMCLEHYKVDPANFEFITWEIITIYISEQMWSCWRTWTKLLEIPA